MDITPPMGNNLTMGNTLLSVADLTCARGGLPVLSGVSFEVSAGEALVLTGRNGSGKTTLLKVLNRTTDFVPDVHVSGTVKVDGEDYLVMREDDVMAVIEG